MSGNNLFGNDQGQNQPAEVSGADALKLLVGEGCKYATVEDLAKAMVHGQNHINTLQDENAQLRDAAQKQQTVEEMLKEIREASLQPPQEQQQQPTDQQPPATPEQQPDVNELIKAALAERDARTQAQKNADAVKEAIAQKLGDRAAEVYRATGDKLGVDLDKLSSESPQAVINLVLGQQTGAPNASGLSGGHNRDLGSEQPGGHPMSKKAIQSRFDKGEISRHEKIRLENEGLTQLGADFWK